MRHALVLYGTSGCHLCEEAQVLLAKLGSTDWQMVDIAEDDSLVERYGIRIPVLVRADGVELGWPFDAAGLAAFLAVA